VERAHRRPWPPRQRAKRRTIRAGELSATAIPTDSTVTVTTEAATAIALKVHSGHVGIALGG